jgi:hypothetical protein
MMISAIMTTFFGVWNPYSSMIWHSEDFWEPHNLWRSFWCHVNSLEFTEPTLYKCLFPWWALQTALNSLTIIVLLICEELLCLSQTPPSLRFGIIDCPFM